MGSPVAETALLYGLPSAVLGHLAPPIRASITVERLLWWAYGPGRAHGRSWVVDRSLSLDGGLTARPRRRERGSWLLVEACAGLRLKQTAVVTVLGVPDRDVEAINGVVDGLPRVQAEALRRYARGRSRPDWLDTETRLEGERGVDGRGKVLWTNNRHRKAQYCPLRLVIDRRLTERSMGRWAQWREGLETIRRACGELERWSITEALPPLEPWL